MKNTEKKLVTVDEIIEDYAPKSVRPVVITGYWDNEPIWRYKTMTEILQETLNSYE